MDVVQTQRKMAARRSVSASSCDTEESTEERDDSPAPLPAPSSMEPTTTTKPGPFARFRRRAAPPIPLPGGRPRRAYSAPAAPGRRRRRRLLVEDHYRVDPERRVVLPGVPFQEDNVARDLHDFFNLIVLIPVVALNVMNWNWDMIFKMLHDFISGTKTNKSLADAWTGEWFDVFFQVTFLYFVSDLIWVSAVPSCVRSPATIIQHHLATMLYIMVPYFKSEFQWCMGACMIVEINTWFLIARRVFNKQGFPPWIIDFSFFSIRVKVISVLFYTTWISIRCFLYPYLMPRFYQFWVDQTRKDGTPWNLVALVVPLHATFCLLNLKWSYDLLMSKIRFWTRPKGDKKVNQVDKGL